MASWTGIGVVISCLAFGLSFAEYRENQTEKRQPIFDIICTPSKNSDAAYDMLVGGHKGDRRQPLYAGPRIYDYAHDFRAASSHRCELTNDGETPVQNVRLAFRAAYFMAGSQHQLADAGVPSPTLPISVIAPGKPIEIEVTDTDSTDAFLDAPTLSFQRPDGKAYQTYSFPGAGSVSIDLRASPPTRAAEKRKQPKK